MVNIDNLNKKKAKDNLDQTVPEIVKKYYNVPFQIKNNLIELYNYSGFAKLENVLTGNALKYSNKLISSAVYLRKEQDKRIFQVKSEYEKTFLQCGYLCWDYKPVKEFVFAKRFAAIARDLMQVDHVRLWHDQALYKEPGGNPTAVHQDCSYWPIANPANTITMWMALEDVTIDMGSLYFYPGTHDEKLKEYVDIFKKPHLPQSVKDKNKTAVTLKAGDATFHSGLLFHGAGSNRTDKLRKGMTIIYVSEGNTFDASDERNATHTSCIGLKQGEVINTKYTPILV